jgi:hypothetical protein
VHIARIAGMRTKWLVLANWVSGYLFRNHPVRFIEEPCAAKGPDRAGQPGHVPRRAG